MRTSLNPSAVARACGSSKSFSTQTSVLARRRRRIGASALENGPEDLENSGPSEPYEYGRNVRFSQDLLQANPLYDAFEWSYTPPSDGEHGTGIRVFNDPPPFSAYRDWIHNMRFDQDQQPPLEESKEKKELSSRDEIERYDPGFHLPVPYDRLNSLYRYSLVSKRVVHQTGKGRMASFYNLHVVGNGNGLLGYGEGKGDTMEVACRKALYQAVRQMDAVDRFEGRTLWSNLQTKFGATKLFMRPRPVGFGLMCNPNVHQVCKAAGIKDISAKVWGSRNPMNVIKATCNLLQGGGAHQNMGDGIGGIGRRLDKGFGMRGIEAMERERGRRIVNHRTW
jgi:small subunit ribosomal protein S5